MIRFEAESQDLLELKKIGPMDFYLREVKAGIIRQSLQQTSVRRLWVLCESQMHMWSLLQGVSQVGL